MKRHILAWAASAAVLGAAGAAPAMADSPPATQAIGQTAANQQSASANATSTQVNPSNQNIAVRVLSPGDNGSVSQTNASGALALAGNHNDTSQSAGQTQGGGGGGTQAVGQSADSKQSADATAQSTQYKPSNQNIDVRVLSPGDNGSVSQTNASLAGAAAGNHNDTSQSADQTQGGGSGTQAIGQTASNDQHASADASSKQDHPSNVNAPVRVLSPGDNGSVSQTNASLAGALAGNHNDTTQNATQQQGSSYPAPVRKCLDKCDGGSSTGIQAIGQSAASKQDASATATSEQDHPSNVNAPVRVLSPGDNGSVHQANLSFAGAAAGNANDTTQNATQQQGGGPILLCRDSCGGDPSGIGIQAAGQQAFNDQKANATADSKQTGASNTNAPVRTLSPGGGGSVWQLNASGAAALAGNKNSTEQGAQQLQGGGYGTAIQAIGQDAANHQSADSTATSDQFCPSNLNAPVFDSTDGSRGGSVTQANLSGALSLAGNVNRLMQWGQQVQ